MVLFVIVMMLFVYWIIGTFIATAFVMNSIWLSAAELRCKILPVQLAKCFIFGLVGSFVMTIIWAPMWILGYIWYVKMLNALD